METTKTHLDGGTTSFLTSIGKRYVDAGQLQASDRWLGGKLVESLGPEVGTPTRGANFKYTLLESITRGSGGGVPTVTGTAGTAEYAGYEKVAWNTPALKDVTTVTVSIVDNKGRVLKETEYVSDGTATGSYNSTLITQTVNLYDEFGRFAEEWRDGHKIRDINHSNSFNSQYVIETFGEDGIQRVTEVDDQGRVVAEVKCQSGGDLITRYTYKPDFATNESRTTVQRTTGTYSYPVANMTLTGGLGFLPARESRREADQNHRPRQSHDHPRLRHRRQLLEGNDNASEHAGRNAEDVF